MAEIKSLVFDFSWTLLFPRDDAYKGRLGDLNTRLSTGTAYNPTDHFQLNHELLNRLAPLKDAYSLYVFTAGSMHELPAIKQELRKVFLRVYSSRDIGHSKSDPNAFRKLSLLISTPAESILFVDDSPLNVEAAQRAGLQAIRYLTNQKLLEDMKALGIRI